MKKIKPAKKPKKLKVKPEPYNPYQNIDEFLDTDCMGNCYSDADNGL